MSGVYCFANLVGLSVDQMVSANYHENYVSQILTISLVDWSWLVYTSSSYWLWGHHVKCQGHSDLECQMISALFLKIITY